MKVANTLMLVFSILFLELLLGKPLSYLLVSELAKLTGYVSGNLLSER